jgi:hypothetical protein
MAETETVELTEITEPRSLMVRKMNEQMMVAYINRHGRYELDVRTAYVYYDSDGDFVAALANKLEGPGTDAAFKQLDIKFWSKGIM